MTNASNPSNLPTNTAQIIDAIDELAHDNGREQITPSHVAYMFSCSTRHAGRMIQVWEGAARVSIPLPWACATCGSKHPSKVDAAQCSHDRSRVDGGVL